MVRALPTTPSRESAHVHPVCSGHVSVCISTHVPGTHVPCVSARVPGMCVPLRVHLCVCPCAWEMCPPVVHPCVCLPMCLGHVSACGPSVCPSAHVPGHVSVCASIRVSVCPCAWVACHPVSQPYVRGFPTDSSPCFPPTVLLLRMPGECAPRPLTPRPAPWEPESGVLADRPLCLAACKRTSGAPGRPRL